MAGDESTPTFVAIFQSPLVVGRSPSSGLVLGHPTVSRRHATLTGQGDGVSVVDHESRFGTFVNGVRVQSCCARPGDRIQFGTTIIYRVQNDGLQLDVAGRGVTLTAAGLTILRGGRTIVRDIGFSVEADSFVGILGPSGAGKSTILNCLAGYRQPEAGRLLFDGCHDVAFEMEQYRAILGLVPQEDVVYPTLTVEENLYYAALLRLEDYQDAAAEAVARVLERVGLADHRDKPAGVLSGGQRKRLSVAFELLKRPRLLFLDEPTSGLDPASEAHLMEQLRVVARRGTTVLCTTHLMENISLFDRLIVLGVCCGEGRVAFSGPPGDLLGRFRCRGFADLYERLEAGRFTPEASQAAPTTAPPPAATAEHRPVTSGRSSDQSGAPASGRVAIGPLVVESIDRKAWNQGKIVEQRAAKLLRRDQGLVVMNLAQPLALGLLVCLTQFNALSLVPIHFFCVVVALWLGMNNSARDLVRDRKAYVRERLGGLRPGPYLAAKWAVFAAVGLIQVVLLTLMVRILGPVILVEHLASELGESSVIWMLLVLWACYGCGLGLGLLVSTLARTEEAAVAALPLLIMPQILLSAVASGQVHESYVRDRTFRPLVVTLHSPATDIQTGQQELPATGVFVEILSLACYSRPATLLLESPQVTGFSKAIWLGDFCHLMILLLGTVAGLYGAFRWTETKWPRLIGLG